MMATTEKLRKMLHWEIFHATCVAKKLRVASCFVQVARNICYCNTNNEIKFALTNSFCHTKQELLTGFECNAYGFRGVESLLVRNSSMKGMRGLTTMNNPHSFFIPLEGQRSCSHVSGICISVCVDKKMVTKDRYCALFDVNSYFYRLRRHQSFH